MKKQIFLFVAMVVVIMFTPTCQSTVKAATLNITIDNGSINDKQGSNKSDTVKLDDNNDKATIVLEKKKSEDKQDNNYNEKKQQNTNQSIDWQTILDSLNNYSRNGGTPSDEEYVDKFQNLKDYGMEDTSDDMVIEADVKLTGTGSGYHAKIVMGTSQSAVSFGIQYDIGASAPYAGKTMALLENIQSNYNGEQNYPRFAELRRDRTYRLMLTLNKSGYGEAYVNGEKVGSYNNPYVVSSGDIEMWVEGAARLSGDSVTALFSNVKARKNGVVSYNVEGSTVDDSTRENGIVCSETFGLNDLTNDYTTLTQISGTVKGIGDWDSSFAKASSLAHIQF